MLYTAKMTELSMKGQEMCYKSGARRRGSAFCDEVLSTSESSSNRVKPELRESQGGCTASSFREGSWFREDGLVFFSFLVTLVSLN